MRSNLDSFRRSVGESARRALTIASAHVTSSEIYDEFLAPALTLMTGGKRTRALLVLAGYELSSEQPSESVTAAASAMELYQASALIHDDVIDDSSMRRGVPASHVQFSRLHSDEGFGGSASTFGQAGAILLGDFVLAASMSEIRRAVRIAELSSQGSDYSAVEQLFHDMAAEVAFGQYLDIRTEHEPLAHANDAQRRAFEVMRHKTVGYSVRTPLLLGAHLGQAEPRLIALLEQLSEPLGLAFQLRDDSLGIFGDPADTGKPACGDITEGKRTVLLSLTRDLCSDDDRRWLDGKLGKVLSDDEVERVRSIVVVSGAHAEHEKLIESYETLADDICGEISRAARREGVEVLNGIMASLRGRTS
ncbi:polyprenyl synthetase family protein [Arcanobacterium haemolyticum]|nr:polyprenyl synthetase family protein [Arcanobacterium haemolyticum]